MPAGALVVVAGGIVAGMVIVRRVDVPVRVNVAVVAVGVNVVMMIARG